MSVETYGRYQLLKKLATGGMAQIYLGRQVGLEGFEKLMVVKRILPHLAENDDFITMFLDEARIAARLNHPNIVQIFDLGAQDESFFIAMEYIHGEDVRRVWKRAEQAGRPVPVPMVLRIVIEACAGLDYAHKKADQSGRPLNIVHRDISPQNILVSFEGHVKIVDFGIAKAADQATVTRSGVLKGKYSYMSPEQAAGKAIDHRSDIFAVGVVLYELLTQTRLFKRGNDIQTLNAVTACEVVPPSQVSARCPLDLDSIVMRALARDRADRYEEARLLQADLEEWLLAHKLPSSSVHLAAFMQEIYADRLAREAEEGRLLFETQEAAKSEELEKATPAEKGARPTRSMRSSGPVSQRSVPRQTREVEATSAERPSKSGPTSKNKALEKAIEELPDHKPRASTDQSVSVPTQTETAKRWPRVVAALAGVAAVGVIAAVALKPGPRPLAEVTVASDPPGAEVRFDGRPVECVTPCRLPARPPGKYALALSLDGYEPLTANVAVPDPGLKVTLPVFALAKARGQLAPPAVRTTVAVTSEPPGAAVSADGAPQGNTPLELSLEPGRAVRLELSLDGYQPHSDAFTVGAASPEAHAYALEKKPAEVVVRPPRRDPPRRDPPPDVKAMGNVRFIVKPWASVECPPYKFGDTPFSDRAMAAGEYRCTFKNPDLGEQTRAVKVEANTLTKVQVSFGP